MLRRFSNPSFIVVLLLLSTHFMGFLGLSAAIETDLSSSVEMPSNRPLLFVDSPTDVSVGTTFTLKVKIFNLTDNVVTMIDPYGRPQQYPIGNLYGLQFRFQWDPAVLQYQSRHVTIPYKDQYGATIYPDGVLNGPTMMVKNTVDAAAGTYDIIYASTHPAEAFNNPGTANTIFNMTFQVKTEGASVLKLRGIPPDTNVKLAAIPTAPYPTVLHMKQDGTFRTPGAPTASFTVSPSDGYAGANKTVVFDASASFDPDGVINTYKWDFGDENQTDTSNPTITHSYKKSGSFKVSLKVIDDDGAGSAVEEKTLTVVDRRDIAVSNIILNATLLLWGDSLGINVTFANLGGAPETFTLSAFYNSTPVSPTGTTWNLIGARITSVKANSENLTAFSLDSSTLPAVNMTYAFFVNLTLVPHEYNAEDNSWDFVNNPKYVQVSTVTSHDIALASLDVYMAYGTETASSPFVKNENVTICFDAKANGTADEIFDVTLQVIMPNGTVLLTHQWSDESLLRQRFKEFSFFTTELAVGNLNVTVTATVEGDTHPGDNFLQHQIDVVNPPVISINYPSGRITEGDEITFDAEDSQQPGGELSTFQWSVKRPGTEVFSDVKTGKVVSYKLDEGGTWIVRLIVTDSKGLSYAMLRSATSAYMSEVSVQVERQSAFSWELIVAGAAIAVVVIIALVYLMRLRRAKPEIPS